MERDFTTEETIENADYSGQNRENAEYEYCTFRNCHFSNTSLAGNKFLETEFIDCDFSNANLSNVLLQEVKFTNCKMLGLHFDKCNMFGFSAEFNQCQLNHSVFYGMKLGRTSFISCQLQGVDFGGAELKGVSLKSCDFLNAIFENTNLEKADFSKSIHYSIDPEMNKVKGAKFSLPEVVGLLHKYNLQID